MKKMHLVIRGERKGPFTLEEIRRQLDCGEVGLFDVVETDGRRVTLQEILPEEMRSPAGERPSAPPRLPVDDRPPPPVPQLPRDPLSSAPYRPPPPPPPASSLPWQPSVYQPAAITEPLAIWSFILGLCAVLGSPFCCGCILGIPSVICGHLAISKIDKTPGLAGRGLAVAGLVLGYIGIIIFFLLFFTGVLSTFLEAAVK